MLVSFLPAVLSWVTISQSYWGAQIETIQAQYSSNGAWGGKEWWEDSDSD